MYPREKLQSQWPLSERLLPNIYSFTNLCFQSYFKDNITLTFHTKSVCINYYFFLPWYTKSLIIIIMINISNIITITLGFSLLAFLVLSQSIDNNTLNVTINTGNNSVMAVTNGVANNYFIENMRKLGCPLSLLYTYRQNNQNYQQNGPYYLNLSGLNQPTAVSISTVHENISPTFSPTICFPPACSITIQNGCPFPLTFFNYFDRVIVNIQNYQELSYYVICNDDRLNNTFEFGMIIEIVVITVLMTIVAIFSRAWSLGGNGIEINVWLVLVFQVALVIGIVILHFSDTAINIILTIVSFFMGIIGVAICSNELLFLLRLKCLNYSFFKIGGTFQFRMLQVVSLLLGTGVLLSWYYSNKNMILNDAICFCMIVGFIKILKFTSLKMAGLTFLATILVQQVALFILNNGSYDSLVMNNYNFPIQLQVPTINPVYLQKCAWLPITAVIFPGMLFSYLRRFDTSRSTKIYLIIGTLTFFIGGISWMFISIPTPESLPFGLISEPCMFSLICLFSFRRRELRTLWDGLFYDPQFSNREDLQVAIEMIGTSSRRSSMKTIDSNLIQNLKEGINEVSFRSTDSNAIRRNFLKGSL